MAQFDVYRVGSGELVLDCQSDWVGFLDTRFVIPLLNPDLVPNAIKGLHPAFKVDGQEFLMVTQLGAAVQRNELIEPLLSLERHRYTIIKALDFLITGV